MPDIFVEDNIDGLMLIEVTVARFYAKNPPLLDRNIDKIYEAFQRQNEKIIQGKNPPSLRFNDLEQALYNQLEPLLPLIFQEEEEEPKELRNEERAELVAIMKRLRKSIKTWTGSSGFGKQGYLDYISNFFA